VEPDKFQQAWRAESSQRRLTIDADLLLREVQRNERQFRTMIFFRDCREIIVALLLIPAWFYLGSALSLPWSWYLEVPAMMWVVAYFVVDRLRFKQRSRQSSEPPLERPLLESVKESLAQVDHQIGLLRNVFWWYLLPLLIPMLIFFGQATWLRWSAERFYAMALMYAFLVVFVGAVFCLVDFVNQFAIRSQLEPRYHELLGLLASLGAEGATQQDVTRRRGRSIGNLRLFRRWALVNGSSLAACAVLTLVASLFLFRPALPREGATSSPFAALRWQESLPEVRVGDEWFALLSFDGIPTPEIVAFSQRTYGSDWQQRFEKDLTELPARMGHPRPEKITYVLEPLKERSPFAAVRWQNSQPEVKVGDEWFKLVSLDGIPAGDIIAFSQQTFGDNWRMRFEEDLVVLLTRMQHPPGETVTLVVQSLASPETRTLKNVPMTKANRWAIKRAATEREERSPFTAVRWQDSQPEVKVGDHWFKLVSLDGIAASNIVAFSQRTYGDQWKLRFEERLVVLLIRMGHLPGDTVTLEVQSLTSAETKTLENAPMTKANRRAIQAARKPASAKP
jgi:hypothetical protein